MGTKTTAKILQGKAQTNFFSNCNLVEVGLSNTPDLTIFLCLLPAVLTCPMCLPPSLEPKHSFFEQGYQGYHLEHQRTSEVKNPHLASALNEIVVTHSHHFRRIINSSCPRDSLFICLSCNYSSFQNSPLFPLHTERCTNRPT